MKRKTYLKAKNVQTFLAVLRMTAWNSFFAPKRKPEFTDNFQVCLLPVILSAVALPVVPKVEFNVVVILYITILVFLSPGTCFKSTIRFQSTQIVIFIIRGGWRKKFFTRKVWEDSALPNIPFWGHLSIYLCFSFLFKSQRRNFSVLGMRTRPWKFYI